METWHGPCVTDNQMHWLCPMNIGSSKQIPGLYIKRQMMTDKLKQGQYKTLLPSKTNKQEARLPSFLLLGPTW